MNLDDLSDEEVRRRYREAGEVLQGLADRQGHDRCWYNPEVLAKLLQIFDISPSVSPNLPPRREFEEGCRRYQDEQYGKKRE